MRALSEQGQRDKAFAMLTTMGSTVVMVLFGMWLLFVG